MGSSLIILYIISQTGQYGLAIKTKNVLIGNACCKEYNKIKMLEGRVFKLTVNVDKFVQEHQDKIITLVNNSLNRAGDIVAKKVQSGEVGATIQDVLPVMLYEILLTNTVATLRLVADMLNESAEEMN
ncbi:hypothetical protein SAMN02745133_00251 [Desulforamulus putei DSM 12395]|uniref:Uncharacterized protein n=1 Tax=Desulforamulus putei DSM 12395 TaxID=1121429 RepID=A0A1M4SVB7_9FIRM|nr:hypothetical protein SAMN02745133_00251 [Desulforamulus putei DSM 12395]